MRDGFKLILTTNKFVLKKLSRRNFNGQSQRIAKNTSDRLKMWNRSDSERNLEPHCTVVFLYSAPHLINSTFALIGFSANPFFHILTFSTLALNYITNLLLLEPAFNPVVKTLKESRDGLSTLILCFSLSSVTFGIWGARVSESDIFREAVARVRICPAEFYLNIIMNFNWSVSLPEIWMWKEEE